MLEATHYILTEYTHPKLYELLTLCTKLEIPNIYLNLSYINLDELERKAEELSLLNTEDFEDFINTRGVIINFLTDKYNLKDLNDFIEEFMILYPQKPNYQGIYWFNLKTSLLIKLTDFKCYINHQESSMNVTKNYEVLLNSK